MKPIDVKLKIYFEFEDESNDKDPKFWVGDHVKISKYKNIKKLKILCHGYM